MDAGRLSEAEVVVGRGLFGRVGDLLGELAPASIMLVTGGSSYERSGAKAILEPALEGRPVLRIEAVEDNPTFEEVAAGVQRIAEFAAASGEPELVIAVGGGKALDLAKLLVAARAQSGPLLEVVKAKRLEGVSTPLLAVPTTAGTGSETTHFATVYDGSTKYSVAHQTLLPRYAFVDAALCDSLPASVTASTGLDALCQAIESSWAVGSTDASREDAFAAMKLVAENLEATVTRPNAPGRDAMSEAAYLAGRAINVSKTTASHALSYAMTIRWGVPHGHAVALTLPALLRFNAGVGDDDVNDPRGADHVRSVIGRISETLGSTSADAAAARLTELIQASGLGPSPADLGIQTTEDLEWVAGQVNPERLANNPRRLSAADLLNLLNHPAG